MNILMIGNICNVGSNLKKGLEQFGHTVTIVDNPSVLHDDVASYPLAWKGVVKSPWSSNDRFDIIHIHSPNMKKLGNCLGWLRRSRVVCHWHGSDLRHGWKAWPVYHWLLRFGSFHLYSTVDLAWWLRSVSNSKKCLFRCPVDTSVFKPNGDTRNGCIVFDGGAHSFNTHRIPHYRMPDELNKYESVDIRNADGLHESLLSVIGLEAASCGCRVVQYPWMTREWVKENASVMSQANQLLQIYKKVIG